MMWCAFPRSFHADIITLRSDTENKLTSFIFIIIWKIYLRRTVSRFEPNNQYSYKKD